MDILNIERNKIIVENCKKLLEVCDKEDCVVLINIKNEAQKKINNFNKCNLTVSDLSKVEKGLFYGVVKKIIYGRYLNPVLKKINKDNKNYYGVRDKIKNKYKTACTKTKFPNDLMLKYVLLHRMKQNNKANEDFYIVIKDRIHLEILKQFQEQNEKIINKY